MRIQKYISLTGALSRREVNRLIALERVTINGVVAVKNSMVTEGSLVRVDGQELKHKKRDIYLLLNKPLGITCTAQPAVKGNIIDFLQYPERVFPVGRLDKDSEGLILLTNDGDIVNKLMKEEGNHEKEYVVTVDRPIPDHVLISLEQGVEILGQQTKRCRVKRQSCDTFTIVLTQGLNRQIRRMTKAFGYHVKRLVRIRILDLSIQQLDVGQWRELNESEIVQLKNQLRSK
ncbi:pseudouridine synthase [Halalkalibacter alkalisediminis]|uniref:Pseudouridine synthase n=1 Tax=Halalkalibacter alkalisediminis TaxID=935616 RepID=A0ABV6N9H9_9BACI|nr:pseudouridine synthase [Halalkalibacter alkalisediminis]